ncbi:hypothetical protein T03_10703 [Trichinella britovi]|uniref:Uncharacterized protein n=1 Tax=Trichinella britovi TaxID=45882 RepID=A0A0V1C6L5_TRIBR|nr:hypothetical protein T03_10703 [Trichinella britovi]
MHVSSVRSVSSSLVVIIVVAFAFAVLARCRFPCVTVNGFLVKLDIMWNCKECHNGDKSGITSPTSVFRMDQVTFRAPVQFFMGTDTSVWLASMEEYLEHVYAPPLTGTAPFADFAKLFAVRYSRIQWTPPLRLIQVCLPSATTPGFAERICQRDNAA